MGRDVSGGAGGADFEGETEAKVLDEELDDVVLRVDSGDVVALECACETGIEPIAGSEALGRGFRGTSVSAPASELLLYTGVTGDQG
jgi:hypothetical protein